MQKVILSILLLVTVSIHASDYSNGDTVKRSYSNNSYWSGIIQNISESSYQIKLTEIEVNGFLILWINPSECTGQEQLSSSSKGKRIWIPKWCVD